MPVTVASVPRFVPLDAEREKKIDQLLAKIKKNYDPLPVMLQYSIDTTPKDENLPTVRNPERLYPYMFLVSRQWDVDKAYAMFEDVAAYRKENKLDRIVMTPTSFSLRGYDQEAVNKFIGREQRKRPDRYDKVIAGVDQHFSAGIHYWDKEGLPILYMVIGTVDEPGLLKRLKQLATVGQKPEDVLWEYVQHAIGVGEEIALYQQTLWDSGELAKDGVDASSGNIRSVTIIVDCLGLNYKMLWKPALDLFKNTLSRIFRYHPDCVHRIMVVNCPGMVMFAYNIVKGVIDEGVQRKISFFPPKDTLEALEQVMDKKHIPKFLGGDCECEGNCIGPHNPDDPKRKENEGAGDDSVEDVVTEDIQIKAGKKHEKVFVLKTNETVYWDFATDEGKDVAFTLYFVPNSKQVGKPGKSPSSKDLEPFIVSNGRPSAGTDSYKAPEDGTAMLIWDNKHSWFRSKKVQMRVYMQGVDGDCSSGASKPVRGLTSPTSAGSASVATSPVAGKK